MEKNRFFEEINGNFGFGCMRLPTSGQEIDTQQLCAMIDAYLDAGFNYFDTAHRYMDGRSETSLRECLVKRYPRSSFVLTDKLSSYHFTKREEIRPLFEAELAACGVDHFDFYLMHGQDRRIYEKYQKLNVYETAYEFKKEGKIRHFGISFHDNAEVLETILTAHPEIELVQIQFNYADYDDISVDSRRVYEVCEKYNKPVAVMEPVKGGSLAQLPEKASQVLRKLGGGSDASYALRFAAGFPNICVVLSGMSSLEQMRDNLATMRDYRPLDERELKAVGEVRELFRSGHSVPCTGCRYCVSENRCPADIQIPEVFAALNSLGTFQNFGTRMYYSNVVTAGHGKASDCVKCGGCEDICPQHLPIRTHLEKAAAAFDK